MNGRSGFAAAEARADVYARITDRIIADLDRGVRPWMQPWSSKPVERRIIRPLRATGEPYRGINTVVLWSEAEEKGYTSPIWLTFKQATALGGHIRRGERGTLIVYASRFRKIETNDDGQQVEQEIPFLRGYTVFNALQTEGLPERFSAVSEPSEQPKFERLAHAEAFVVNTRAVIRHGGDRAFYMPGAGYVQMPPFESFRDAESYYGVLNHELIHWTAHRSRLDRNFGQKRFGDSGYALEELTGEIGSAFVCADLGLELEPRPDHAAYVASWLTALRNDKRMIFQASGHAQRAADYLHGLQKATTTGPGLSDPEPAMATAA